MLLKTRRLFEALAASPGVAVPGFCQLGRAGIVLGRVFASDRIAVFGRSYLDPQHSARFYKLAGPSAEKRLEAGASFVSSLWYTAWVRAGKPVFPGRPMVSHSVRSVDH